MAQFTLGTRSLEISDSRFRATHLPARGGVDWAFEFEATGDTCLFLLASSRIGATPRLLLEHPRSLKLARDLYDHTLLIDGEPSFLKEVRCRLRDLDPVSRSVTAHVEGRVRRSWFRSWWLRIEARCRFDGILVFGESEEAVREACDDFVAKHDVDLELVVEKVPSGYQGTMGYPLARPRPGAT